MRQLRKIVQQVRGSYLHLISKHRTSYNISFKSIIDHNPEVKKVIRFYFYRLSSKELTKCIISKLKRLSSSLFICRTQNDRFKGGFESVSFPSNWYEAKVNFWETSFCCSTLKCVEAQQLHVSIFFCCYTNK